MLRRARRLLAAPATHERLKVLAAAEGMEALAALVADPDRLERSGRRGRLPTHAVLAALRSRAARAALRERIGARLGARRRPSGRACS